MYLVDLYLRVRLACHVEELSQREAARRFGIRCGLLLRDGQIIRPIPLTILSPGFTVVDPADLSPELGPSESGTSLV